MSETIRVLVLDGDEQLRFATARMLEEAGYEVVTAGDQREAMEQIDRQRPDLALLDVVLADGSGLDLCRRIKGDPRLEGILVVLVSGVQISAEEQVEGLEARADGYIARPFTRREFLARVEALARIQRAERRVRDSEARFRAVVENAFAGLGIVDPREKIVFANAAFAEMLGYAEDELVGMSLAQLSDPDEFARHVERTAARKQGRRDSYETTLARRDGTRCRMMVSVSPLWSGSGEFAGTLGVVVDISQRHRLEQERIRLERVRAVGQLAAGISHNLNNILTGALMPAQLIRRDATDPQIQADADDIIAATLQARDLVRRLEQSVNSEGEGALHAVPVGEIATEAVEATRPRWKDESEVRGISVDMEVEIGDVPAIRGTRSGLRQALVDVILNAVEAMPEGGTISVRAREEGGRVQLRVEDTGLGLSMAYQTVTSWGGDIRVESAPGQGTTFTLLLPVWEEEGSVPQPASRRARVLVAEDDARIRAALARILGKEHQVETVEDGRQALAAFASGQFDAALIDLGMPGVPGDQVALRMRQLDPAVATVLVTGWNLEPDDPRLAAFDFRLQKPFSILDQVAQMVARAVELTATRR